MKTIRVRPLLVEAIDKNNIYNLLLRPKGNILKCNTGAEYRRLLSLGWIPQQLILISLEDGKIEVGDTYLNVVSNEIVKVDFTIDYEQNHCKKVIATQDQLSPELIQQLVVEYNNGRMKDFGIEMEKLYSCEAADEFDAVGFCGFRPKLTNGFITVVEKEPILYTEEEIFTFGDKYEEYCINCFGNLPKSFSEWFNQNKKK